MRFDIDEWADSMEGGPRASELFDPEVAALVVLIAGGATGGLAVLPGLPILPAAAIGAALALVALVVYFVRFLVAWVKWWRNDRTVPGPR